MQLKKAALRLEMKARRKKLHEPDDDGPARLVAANLLMLPEIAGDVQRGIKARQGAPHMAAAYTPIQTEIDGIFMLKALNAIQCRCALPVILAQDQPLIFKEWDLEEPLIDGPYGTHEPASVGPDVMPDIILLPLLAFDTRCHRLGYGGGYYDRTLKAYREKGHHFTAIGLAYDGQKCDAIPVDDFDQPLDIIVTEQEIYRP